MIPSSVKEKIVVLNASVEVKSQLRSALGGVFQMIFAEGDERLVAVAKRELPCLILIDQKKTICDQFDLCQKMVREVDLFGIPVMVIIEQSDVKIMAEGFYKGASDYLTKPLIPAEVLVRVGGQLEFAESGQALNGLRKREMDYLSKPGSSMDFSKMKFTEEAKQKILLVDDYPGNLNTLETVLEDLYDVTTASNGKDAIELAFNNRFDLILLDVVMPKMDGYEVCRRLKANEATSDIPIIFITGKSQTQDEIHGFDLGAIDYIVKPFSLAVVMARIRNQMQAAQNRKKLKIFSYVDSLTGLPNRRQFDELLNKEYQRAARECKAISIILVDVDKFKAYNDYYGHVQGDECLRKIGAALSSCQNRATDFVGRYGGEEFVAVLPDTSIEGARHMAQAMLEAVTALALPHASNPKEKIVTVSLGVASCTARVDTKPKALVEKADVLLYSAKQAGRNQLMVESLC